MMKWGIIIEEEDAKRGKRECKRNSPNNWRWRPTDIVHNKNSRIIDEEECNERRDRINTNF